ncbi:hypothetical protein ELQ92_04820 [Labedella populi]|uniref:Glycosyltransferase family 1 protein n=1 Tax=Labedella populi TaxID=2498850 RepID=A0A3S4A2V5_9MICO|nr:hypothetical protein [Labedella populi]RWZ68531.1 hypothetical protein ELQ92_04820 [Labedella populi]
MPPRPLQLLSDLGKLNIGYVRSSEFRAAVLHAHGRTTAAQGDAIDRREQAVAPAAARVFFGLVDSSLALSTLTPASDVPRHVNLVLPEFRADAVFAGVATAIDVLAGIAARVNLPVRVIALARNQIASDADAGRVLLRETFGLDDVEILLRQDLPGSRFHPGDRWIATHWTTAHALDVAAHAELVDRSSVTYLIQDYEPGFTPWSTSFTTARSTYHAGFVPLVNSRPLLDHLERTEGLDVPPEHVFAPAFDGDRLADVAARRGRGDRTTVLFYGRPSKPRNLFELGVASLRRAMQILGDEATSVDVVSAGEAHPPVDLGGGRTLSPLGRMAWDDYFTFLPTANVVLSLQMSPHPSHPPLESAVSGAHVVTNEFYGTRQNLHERLTAVPESPDALGAALVAAIRRERAEGPGSFSPITRDRIGGPLEDALTAIADVVA